MRLSGFVREAAQDIPIAEGSLLCGLQGQRLFDAVEHRPPLAKNDEVCDDLVFIDQTLLRQLRSNVPASQNRHVFSGLILHLSCFRRHAAIHQLRIAPRRLVQCSRKHNLRQNIHPFGHNNIILDSIRCRPLACQELIGNPAEQ